MASVCGGTVIATTVFNAMQVMRGWRESGRGYN
jgi:hypothetical protein